MNRPTVSGSHAGEKSTTYSPISIQYQHVSNRYTDICIIIQCALHVCNMWQKFHCKKSKNEIPFGSFDGDISLVDESSRLVNATVDHIETRLNGFQLITTDVHDLLM